MMPAIHDSMPIALVSLGPIMACLPAYLPVLTPTRCHLILSDQIRSNCLSLFCPRCGLPWAAAQVPVRLAQRRGGWQQHCVSGRRVESSGQLRGGQPLRSQNVIWRSSSSSSKALSCLCTWTGFSSYKVASRRYHRLFHRCCPSPSPLPFSSWSEWRRPRVAHNGSGA